jgi:hypothetical protein
MSFITCRKKGAGSDVGSILRVRFTAMMLSDCPPSSSPPPPPPSARAARRASQVSGCVVSASERAWTQLTRAARTGARRRRDRKREE